MYIAFNVGITSNGYSLYILVCATILQSSEQITPDLQKKLVRERYRQLITLSGFMLTTDWMVDNLTINCLRQNQVIHTKKITVNKCLSNVALG